MCKLFQHKKKKEEKKRIKIAAAKNDKNRREIEFSSMIYIYIYVFIFHHLDCSISSTVQQSGEEGRMRTLPRNPVLPFLPHSSSIIQRKLIPQLNPRGMFSRKSGVFYTVPARIITELNKQTLRLRQKFSFIFRMKRNASLAKGRIVYI